MFKIKYEFINININISLIIILFQINKYMINPDNINKA
jgi:hypothetical protein